MYNILRIYFFLGTLLFTVYTSPISHIAASHNIQQHQHADDTQLFVALTSNNVHAQLSTLESCLSSLQAWFCSNSMIMNPDISNSILFATTQRAHSLPDQISVNISGVSIPLCNHDKILGADDPPWRYRTSHFVRTLIGSVGTKAHDKCWE